ncbi:PH domain-containing protein [Nocardia sp. NBC_01503]|uniref:PH domain-containing protein n=1 Tax=Nocardia sp. NBC_01503 TaxID=2975997 RepID=UPI002E7C0951|nr:PH domain-containing protein [Nocardia sp. NBC_01503]WTL35804.1 PH domain-containing protein [Nocardia sp. NBC_01503]
MSHPSWQRLDRRMLLVHPITELIRFIPVLLATLIAGARSDSPMWSLGVVGVIVVLALTRWFTTTYRITPDNVELRTGLLQRKRLSVPRNRVRSVDVEADLLHRALGLAVLSIGTGQQAERGDRFKLDSLDASLVPALRTTLLEHTREHTHGGAETATAQADTATTDGVLLTKPVADAPAPPRHPPVEITHWQPKWVRYAPLSLTGFAIIAPIVGLLFQYGFARVIFDSNAVQGVEDGGAQAIAFAVLLLIFFLVAFVSLAACARYLMTYYGLRVIDDGATLHIRHGLFTTRQITLDLARLRGATVNEPLLLRMAGAAELETIMTGTKSRQKIVPQAPREAVDHTLAHLLDSTAAIDSVDRTAVTANTGSASSEAHLTIPPVVTAALRSHGPAATRRRYTRALTPPLLAAAVLIVFSLAGVTIPAWIWALVVIAAAIATALAWDRARGLGHAAIPARGDNPTWLITRSGSLDRDRDCLEGPGIIGWTVRQSWFQRRVGLATITAATAAGKKRYRVIDIPIDQAWPLIDAVTPGQLGSR